MAAAPILVFFQLIHHITFYYSLLNLVVPVSHFYVPYRVGWPGQGGHSGTVTDVRFTGFTHRFHDFFDSIVGL